MQPPNNPIPSPYSPSHDEFKIDKETFEQVMKFLGVESLLIIAEKKKNNCNGVDCLGHYTFFRSEGFNEHNLAGIGQVLTEYPLDVSKSNQNMI